MRSRILILFIVISSCGKEAFVRSYPTVTTQPPVILYNEGAMFSGSFNNATFSDILQHGFVWGEKDDLQVGSSYTIELGAPQNTNFNATIAGTFTSSKEYFVRSYITTLTYTIYGNVQKFVSRGSEGPVITDFHPKSGFQNDTIVIKGRNFFASKSNPIKVRFTYNNADNFYTNVLSVSEKELKILVPTELPLQISWIVIELPGNAGANSQPFTLLLPQILGSSPGAVRLCDSIYVAGNNFKALTSVIFDGKSYPFANHGDTIRFPVLKEFKTNSSLQLMAYKVSAQGSFSGSFVSPQIINIDRTTLSPGDTTEITYNYLPSCMNYTMQIEYHPGINLSVVSKNASKVKFRIAENQCLPATFNVFADFAPSAKTPELTTVYTSIKGITPSVITPGIPATLTLNTPLRSPSSSTHVYAGGSLATIVKQNTSAIDFIVPEALFGTSGGSVNVGLKVCGTNMVFPVPVAPPTLTDFNPKLLTTKGQIVTITGTGFSAAPEYNTVIFNGNSASVIGASHNQLSVSLDAQFSNNKISFKVQDDLQINVGGQTAVSSTPLTIDYTGTWTPLGVFPGGKRVGPGSFSIGGKGYVMMGYDYSNYLKDVWEYDPSTSQWTQLSPFPGAARSSPAVFVVNNKAYIGMGRTDSNSFNDLWQFDPASGNWTQMNDFPGAARMNSLTYMLNNQCYYGGGYNNSNYFLPDFWRYDPSSNTWQQKASLTAGEFGLGCPTHFEYNSKAYYVYQPINSANINLFQYDPSFDNWVSFGSSGYSADAFYGFAPELTNGVLVGASIYNPEQGSTSTFYLFNKRVSGFQFVINSIIYAGAGFSGSPSTLYDDFGIVDPTK